MSPDTHGAVVASTWTVLIPVKDPRRGKSRLGTTHSVATATAIARDTIEAAAAAHRVARVVVTTDDASWAQSLEVPLVRQRRAGLNGAVMDGLAVLEAGPVAVLLGDVAALDPRDLDEALSGADRVEKGFVPDEAGTGTVLLTAQPGAAHAVRFGPGSAAAHALLGYRRLDTRDETTLRLDVDTPADLARARLLGVGPHLRRALAPGAPTPSSPHSTVSGYPRRETTPSSGRAR
jgi:2-phospho-L-lactate guanylyltransferase